MTHRMSLHIIIMSSNHIKYVVSFVEIAAGDDDVSTLFREIVLQLRHVIERLSIARVFGQVLRSPIIATGVVPSMYVDHRD